MQLPKRAKKPAASVNITSLMDVMTIILLFLLVNYSETVSEAKVPSNITMPISTSTADSDMPKEDAMLVIAKQRIDVDGQAIEFASYNRERQLILDNVQAVMAKVWRRKLKGLQSPRLTVAVDKDLPYSMVKEVMSACADVGVTRFEFVALKE